MYICYVMLCNLWRKLFGRQGKLGWLEPKTICKPANEPATSANQLHSIPQDANSLISSSSPRQTRQVSTCHCHYPSMTSSFDVIAKELLLIDRRVEDYEGFGGIMRVGIEQIHLMRQARAIKHYQPLCKKFASPPPLEANTFSDLYTVDKEKF